MMAKVTEGKADKAPGKWQTQERWVILPHPGHGLGSDLVKHVLGTRPVTGSLS